MRQPELRRRSKGRNWRARCQSTRTGTWWLKAKRCAERPVPEAAEQSKWPHGIGPFSFYLGDILDLGWDIVHLVGLRSSLTLWSGFCTINWNIFVMFEIYIYIHTLRCITLHYITLRYVTLRYTTLHFSTLHYITISYHYIPLHTITYHYIALHTITYHYITLHYITLHWIAWHYITLNYIKLHMTLHTLHYTTLHYITVHYITLHTYINIYIHRTHVYIITIILIDYPCL